MSNDTTTKRYNSLLKREFKYKLELFLFQLYLEKSNLDEATTELFTKFINDNINNDIVTLYHGACQLPTSEDISHHNKNYKINDIDKAFNTWEGYSNKEYFNVFSEYFKKKFSEANLVNIYPKNINERICHYCGINEYDIERLNKEGKLKTKRLLTRGKSLEFDRVNPSGDYSKNNIVLSCYWCNNAKSDEFTYREFKEKVAPGITEVWKIRLDKNIDPPIMFKIGKDGNAFRS